MRLSFLFVVAIASGCLAACTGGGGSPLVAIPTATPVATPAAVTTSVPIGTGVALVEQPITAAVPAPTGYSASVSIPLVTTGANTKISVVAGASPPSSIPVISTSRRAVVRPFVSGQFNAIYYDVVTPSQSITVAGNISITQQFPAGTLGATTQYYLGFFDTTQSSPTWQTISGPVSASGTGGNSLTFSGNVGSFTLQQNATYAFCIFSTASSSVTPPPSQAVDTAYLSQFTNGILVVNAAGQTVNTLAINSNSLSLDDSGAVYNLYSANPPSPLPGASSSPTPPPSVVQYYAPGSTTPTRTYQSFSNTEFIAGSGSGEVVTVANSPDPSGLGVDIDLDVWNPGSTGGAPSYTLSALQAGSPNFDVQHDGTIYIGTVSSSGAFSYAVYPPGSPTASRTIPETIVPLANQANFAPNYMTVGPDGTLYVTEYSFTNGDPLAGLYIYPPNGAEKFIQTTSNSQGAGPEGVDVDAAGNIYVANNNAGFDPNSGNPTTDTLNDVEVFAPGGASVLRHITGSFNAYPLVVAPDGTAFFGSFGFAGQPGTNGTFVIAPGSSTTTQVAAQGENSIVLYNGYSESAALKHRMSSQSFGAAAAHAGAAAMRNYLRMTRHIH